MSVKEKTTLGVISGSLCPWKCRDWCWSSTVRTTHVTTDPCSWTITMGQRVLILMIPRLYLFKKSWTTQIPNIPTAMKKSGYAVDKIKTSPIHLQTPPQWFRFNNSLVKPPILDCSNIGIHPLRRALRDCRNPLFLDDFFMPALTHTLPIPPLG